MTRCSTPWHARGCRPTSPPTCGTIPPTSTAAPRTSHWSTSRTGPASTRGASRPPRCCAVTSVTHLPVRVSRHPDRPMERWRAADESRSMRSNVRCSSWPSSTPSWAGSTTAPPPRRTAALEQLEAEHRAANDRVAVLEIAIEDLDGQVARLESEIDARPSARGPRPHAARLTGDAIPSSSPNCSTNWRPCSAARGSWRIRCSRSWSAASNCSPSSPPGSAASTDLADELAPARQARDAALAEIEQTRGDRVARRCADRETLDAELVRCTSAARTAAPGRCAAGSSLWGVPHRDRPRRAVPHRRGRRRRRAALPGVWRNPVAGHEGWRHEGRRRGGRRFAG